MWRIITIIILIFIAIYCYMDSVSVVVYRFYRPSCPYCVSSEEAWRGFKNRSQMKAIKCIEVNLDDGAEVDDIVENFGVKSVPTVVAVSPKGLRYYHDGDRTASGYSSWVCSIPH